MAGVSTAAGGTITVSNSTFSGNSAKAGGTGRCHLQRLGTFTASFSTFASNSAAHGGVLSNAAELSSITSCSAYSRAPRQVETAAEARRLTAATKSHRQPGELWAQRF